MLHAPTRSWLLSQSPIVDGLYPVSGD